MLKMSSQVENIVNAYKTLAKIPSVVGGRLNNKANRISSKWSIRNLDKGKSSKYMFYYLLNDDLDVVMESDFGNDTSSEILSAISPNETYKAVIREEKESKESKKQYLEVWHRNQLSHCFDLTALELHGDVYADSEFGSLSWNQDESAIVYVAEKKLPKSEPYIKRKGEDKSKTEDNGSSAKVVQKGEEYVYKQDWGEQLVGKHLSVVVMCRPADESFKVLEGLPESWCPGQVRFSQDGSSVYGVAWETEPRRLGLIFCTNRLSYIFNLTLDGKMTKLSSEGFAVRSPRVSPRGEVFWLQRTKGGPHHACHSLVVYREDKVVPVIDIVDTQVLTENKEPFHGIYSQGLPVYCFSADGARIVFSTPQKHEVKCYVVHVDTGKIVDISNKDFRGSMSVLDVKSDVILAAGSNMTTPAQLYIARLPKQGEEVNIKWKQISNNVSAPPSVKESTIEYMELEHTESTDSVKSFTALYFTPKVENNGKLPLIVWPHGGPHSGFVNAFSLEAALFNMLGFASARINYRGSTGQGDAFVRCLIGKVGIYDVEDSRLVLTTLLQRDGRLRNNVFLYGGSYGGLVVGHLAGVLREECRAMVMRNPLIDLATKGQIADNSDGCAVEAGYEFDEAGPVLEEQLLAMRRCSPLVHVHKVKAATALMLGGVDKRVPLHQGMEYARRLKANGVKTKVYVYEDNHSLSNIPVEMDNLINSAKWFIEHS